MEWPLPNVRQTLNIRTHVRKFLHSSNENVRKYIYAHSKFERNVGEWPNWQAPCEMERQARRTPSDKFRLAVRHNHRKIESKQALMPLTMATCERDGYLILFPAARMPLLMVLTCHETIVKVVKK